VLEGYEPSRRIIFRPVQDNEWAHIDEIIDEMLEMMRQEETKQASSSNSQPVRVATKTKSKPKSKVGIYNTEDLMLAQNAPLRTMKGSINPRSSTTMRLLSKLVGARWEGNELITVKPTKGGEHAIAKFERKAVTLGGSLVPVHRISSRPRVHLTTNAAGSYTWKNYGDFEMPKVGVADVERAALMEFAEGLALYSVCLPNFVEWQDHHTSYQEYIDNPNKFLEDLDKFYAISEEKLLEMATAERVPVNTVRSSIHEQVLAHGLAVGGQPRVSLRHFIQNVNTPNKATAVTTNPSGETIMPAPTGRDRIKASIKRGTVTGIISATNRQVVDMTLSALGDKCPDVLKTEVGRALLEGAIPGLFLLVADTPLAAKLPPAMLAQAIKAAEFAFEGFVTNASGKVTEELFTVLAPLLQAYVSAGEQLQALEETPDMEDLLVSRQPERVEAMKAL